MHACKRPEVRGQRSEVRGQRLARHVQRLAWATAYRAQVLSVERTRDDALHHGRGHVTIGAMGATRHGRRGLSSGVGSSGWHLAARHRCLPLLSSPATYEHLADNDCITLRTVQDVERSVELTVVSELPVVDGKVLCEEHSMLNQHARCRIFWQAAYSQVRTQESAQHCAVVEVAGEHLRNMLKRWGLAAATILLAQPELLQYAHLQVPFSKISACGLDSLRTLPLQIKPVVAVRCQAHFSDREEVGTTL